MKRGKAATNLRLTGYVYLPGKGTKTPGMEALFPIHR